MAGIDTWIVYEDIDSLLKFVLENSYCRDLDELFAMDIGELIIRLTNNIGDFTDSSRIIDCDMFPVPPKIKYKKDGSPMSLNVGWHIPACLVYLMYFYMKSEEYVESKWNVHYRLLPWYNMPNLI